MALSSTQIKSAAERLHQAEKSRTQIKGDTIQADYGAYGTVSCYFA